MPPKHVCATIASSHVREQSGLPLQRYPQTIAIAIASALVTLLSLWSGGTEVQSPIAWIAPGLIAAMLVRFGSWHWPAAAMGVAAASIPYGFAPVLVLMGTLAAISGPWALARYLEWSSFDRHLQRRQDVLHFATAAVPAAALSATLLTLGVALMAPQLRPPMGALCLAALFNNMLGFALLVPTLASTSPDQLAAWRAQRSVAALLLLAVVVVLLAGLAMPTQIVRPLALPAGVVIVVVSAMRLGLTFTSLLATLLTIGIAIVTVATEGPVAVTSVVRVWSFGTVLSALALTVRALLAERDAADARLRSTEVAYRKDLLDAARHEQQRLSHEMHDALGQDLTAISLLARQLCRVAPPNSVLGTDAQAIAAAADQAQAAARQIVRGLTTQIAGTTQLCDALRELAERARLTLGIDVTMDLDPDVTLSPTAAQSLYRIAQEAMTNVMRHAKARHVALRLRARDAHVQLDIEDDGVGFVPALAGSTAGPADGLGLRTMRYRCELAGGQLQIASTPGGGTRIRCALPPDPTAPPLLAEAATVGDDEPMIENRMRA